MGRREAFWLGSFREGPVNRVSWCLRWSLAECQAGYGLRHSHSGYNTCAQSTVASETARRIQLALPKKGQTLKVKTTLPHCLFTGCSSASFQKLTTQDRSDPGPAMLPSDLTPLTTTQICLSLQEADTQAKGTKPRG